MSRRKRPRGLPADDADDFDEAAFAERERVMRRGGYRDRKSAWNDRQGSRTGAQSAEVPTRRREHAAPAAAAPRTGTMPLVVAVVKGCGSCRNWLADGMPGGRGTCDHPGSGFLHPYQDTPACPFYDG